MRRFFIDDRTVLRPILDTDAGTLYAVINAHREHLRRWLPWLDSTRSRDDVLTFRKRVASQESEALGLARVIERDNTLCGVVSFNHIDPLNNKAHLGYWLDPDYTGRGLCAKSCALLIDYAFSELGLNRVAIAAAVENKRSRAVAERLGFKLEGVQRQAEWLYDHYVDHALYGLLRNEWSRPLSTR
jgi:ribosomal-protein-serine acetyltransferase